MVQYVDYVYYTEKFGGKMSEEDFLLMERRAEAFIRYLTYPNGDIFAIENDMVRDAVCAAANVYYTEIQAARMREAQGVAGPMKAENNDGYSVSYVTERKDGQTAEEYLRQKAYQAVYAYLLPTGWLSRKVRCTHDHKCGCYDL